MSLTDREKTVIILGCLVLAVMIPVYLILFPAMDRKEELKVRLTAETRSLAQAHDLSARYALVSAQSDDLQKSATARPKGFTLFSYIDRLAQKTGVKTKIGYMKPSTRALENERFHIAGVKLRLKGVFFNDLAGFVSEIEGQDPGVGITSISISQSGKGDKEGKELLLLDAVMEIQALVPGGKK